MTAIDRQSSVHRRAFTMIEFLVVVLIVTVLLALGLPTFKAAQTSVRVGAASGAMRQAFTALAMYGGDHDLRYPFFGTPGDPTQPMVIGRTVLPMGDGSLIFRRHTEWTGSGIVPYLSGRFTLDGEDVFPPDTNYPSPNGVFEVFGGRFKITHTVTAESSFWMSDGDFSARLVSGTSMGAVRHPARKGLLLDVGGPGLDDGVVRSADETVPPSHARVAFADGSVRAIPWTTHKNIRPARARFAMSLHLPIMVTEGGLLGWDD